MRSGNQPVSFVLTWNPELKDLDLVSDGAVLASGDRIPARWATGQRRSGIERGDSLWLFRLGKMSSNPGIVRRAIATGEVFRDLHWAPDRAAVGVMTNYVPLEWCEQSPPDSPLTRATLMDGVSAAPWANLQSSGVGLSIVSSQALRELWDAHLRQLRGQPRLAHRPAAVASVKAAKAPPAKPLPMPFVAEEDDGRTRMERMVLQHLRSHPGATAADMKPLAKRESVSGDITLTLYRLHRAGDVLRHGGQPTRWELARALMDPLTVPGGSDPEDVVDIFLAESRSSWSTAQRSSAVQGPNVLRMTAFSRDELQSCIAEAIEESNDSNVWNAWYELASGLRAGSIRL